MFNSTPLVYSVFVSGDEQINYFLKPKSEAKTHLDGCTCHVVGFRPRKTHLSSKDAC